MKTNDEIEKKSYDQFMSGEITITLDDEMAKKARECFGFDEMHAEYEFIKNALEKQIPKKPQIKLHGSTDYNTQCKCPSCGVDVVGSGFYCRNCGQRLDWSGEK